MQTIAHQHLIISKVTLEIWELVIYSRADSWLWRSLCDFKDCLNSKRRLSVWRFWCPTRLFNDTMVATHFSIPGHRLLILINKIQKLLILILNHIFLIDSATSKINYKINWKMSIFAWPKSIAKSIAKAHFPPLCIAQLLGLLCLILFLSKRKWCETA